MKKHLKSLVLATFVLLSGEIVGQAYVGAFENRADGQLYAIKSSPAANAELVRIEVFKEASDVPDVSYPLGAIYSQQFQRIFAVYATESGMVVAHTAGLLENQPLKVKHAFGATFDPNYQAYLGVVLTEDNKLLAFRATY